MRIEHSFDIYAKLYLPTHHFEFYVSFFLLCFCHLFGVMVCSVCMPFFAAANCPPVCLSVRPSLCERVSSPITLVLYQMIRNTYCLWLPNFQGHMAISRSHRPQKPSETGRIQGFRVFSGERMGGNSLKYRTLLYPDHLIIF